MSRIIQDHTLSAVVMSVCIPLGCKCKKDNCFGRDEKIATSKYGNSNVVVKMRYGITACIRIG